MGLGWLDGRGFAEGELSGPDLPLDEHLAFAVLLDQVSAFRLEEERTLLEARVHLAVDENASVKVLLRCLAQCLVLGHDSSVHFSDELEFFFGRGSVAVDFVSHSGLERSVRHETLHEEEMRSGTC